MVRLITNLINMSLPARLIKLRKDKGLTQLVMTETIAIHMNSLKKYESGQTQPSLDVLKKIATALHISSDFLLFEEHERSPNEDLSLQFKAIQELSSDEQSIVKEVLDSLIIKYQARCWDSARN